MGRAPHDQSASGRIATFCTLGGSRDPEKAMLRIAQTIRLRANQADPPFNPRAYCAAYNVEVQDQWLVDCDARLLPIRGGYIAEIQADHRPSRKNFSICHELAHVFFNSHGVDLDRRDICGSQNSPAMVEEERLCNLLAVELLMPTDVFRQVALSLPPGFSSLTRLASAFGVSLQAALKRVVSLNLWECGFAVYLVGQKKK